jgi:uncharacterized 2Fe-2S/4Fe-4S cluster protein (DUF4445 family)
MADLVKIELLPLGRELRIARGTNLRDLLFSHGVEFPCGGRGRCKGCKVKVLAGALPATPEDRLKFSEPEWQAGWRLSCCARAETDLKLELAQWEPNILSDDSTFAFVPQEGWGVAVDLGTTTIVAQLLDLRTGSVLGVRSALNPQAQHGADIMSRVEFAVTEQGQPTLQRLVRDQIGQLVRELQEGAPGEGGTLRKIVVVGNTVMHHLFCGISLEPLAHYPFEPENDRLQIFAAAALGWEFAPGATVAFLPCLGSFVGSDILAGVLTTGLYKGEHLNALIDLGTNGEIVIGNAERMLCASTAAGPAFEGARISMGMRAATGAISEVRIENGTLRCHTIGDVSPRGICGSGLVDAVASGLDLGLLKFTGRFTNGTTLPLAGSVTLNQWDIRELQLAKGAIAAGLRILLEEWGANKDDLGCIYLAGAFGNYINYPSAQRIGLLDFPPEKVVASGNTALAGAKIALFASSENDWNYSEVLSRTRHISLNESARFQDVFVEEMSFPDR